MYMPKSHELNGKITISKNVLVFINSLKMQICNFICAETYWKVIKILRRPHPYLANKSRLGKGTWVVYKEEDKHNNTCNANNVKPGWRNKDFFNSPTAHNMYTDKKLLA